MKTEPEAPVLNSMIEDYLAHAGSEDERVMMLNVWLRLGAEYLARDAGRAAAMDGLGALRSIIRDAQPTRPWKP